MYRNGTPTKTAEYWRIEVEQKLEAGATPVMELGVSNIPSDDAASLFALQRWRLQRTDVLTPILPAGGQGPLWAAALMSPFPSQTEMPIPEPMVVYGGANEAEYLATVTFVQAATRSQDTGAHAKCAAIPPSYFVPQSQPGKAVSWDSFPFLAMSRPLPPTDDLAALEQISAPVASIDPVQDRLAWAALVVALFLVLLAVII